MDTESLESKRRWVTQGPIARVLVSLAAPIVAARLLASTQESIDAIFLGRVSTEDLAAPAAAAPLIWLFAGLGMGINSTLSALVSQAVGARDYAAAQRYASQLLGLTLALALGSLASILLFAESIFRLQGFEGRALELAAAYAAIGALGMPFLLLMFYFNSVMASTGDTRTPFKISALSTLLNVILDPILIFGLFGVPAMGAVGAAIATTASRGVAVAIALALLARGAPGFPVRPSLPTPQLAVATLRIGGPVALQRFVVSLGFLAMMGIVAGLGPAVVAAYNVSLAIIHVIQSATFGFNIAVSTLVGQSLGAGMVSRAVTAAYSGLALVFSVLSLGAIVVLAGREVLVSAFTSIEEVALYAERMIFFVAVGMPFLGVFFTSLGVARGSGHTALVSAIGVARLWLLRIPLAYTLVYIYGLGDVGVWMAMTASNIIAGSATALWVLSKTWVKPVVHGPTQEDNAKHPLPAGGIRNPQPTP